MGNKFNFDVRKKGNTLYIGIVQREDNEVIDVEIKERNIEDYRERYTKNRDPNHYDYMLLGFKEMVKHINELRVYEEGDLVVEYNNHILFGWIEKGLSKGSKVKYRLIYETVLNHLEELVSNLGDNSVSFQLVKKNEAKKHITDSALLKEGKVSEDSSTEFKLTKDSNLSKNRVKKQGRVTGKDLNDKVIRINRVNG